MLKRPTARQTELEMVTLESLVPADHLLRKIDATIDFSFIRITDTHTTAGNVHDCIPYLARLDRQTERFDLDVKAVGFGAGYVNAPVAGVLHHQSQGAENHYPSCLADARERTDAHRLTDLGKRLYKRRKETVERSFADAKQFFGHRYARYRGLTGVKWQCLLAATAQNIKKIATLLSKIPKVCPA